jgi:hypothetical protein
VDPALAAAEAVAACLGERRETLRPEKGKEGGRFFLTHLDARIETAASVLMKKKVKLEKIPMP